MKNKNNKVVKLFIGLMALCAGKGAEAAAVPGEFVVKFKPGTVNAIVGPRLDGNTFLLKAKDPAKLRLLPGVELVEPNYIFRVSELDWSLENQGQMDCESNAGIDGIDVKAVPAWGISRGDARAVVAVIDTGMDIDNPRLRDSVAVNRAEAEGVAGFDDDGNGYVDDVRGYDFSRNQSTVTDEHGHGTFCAGAIVATGGNDAVAGLAPGVKVLPIRFMDSSGAGTLANAIRAIDYAVNQGAKVISASWGGSGRSEALEAAIRRAQERGVLFVAAAGNSGSDLDRFPSYPAAYELSNVLAVTAVDNRGRLPAWANFGAGVHLAAPGVALRGVKVGGGSECMSGTSMATPLVAAAAALMQSVDPSLTGEQLKTKLMETSTPLPELRNATASGGMVNAFAALSSL